MLTDTEIVNNVLVYLDGWEVDTNNTSTVEESAYMSSEELEKNANKYITSTEIMTFYNDVSEEYNTTQRLPNITNVEKLLCKITAGRLWNKYNILVNTNTDMEESTPDRYGSKLIQEAEKKLKFYNPQLVVGLNEL
jgi:hypothetical protein